MAGKRSNGEGTIFKTADGKWKAVVSVGRGPDGKRRRRSKVARTKADAAALLREMLNESDAGIVSLPKFPTVAEYLERWLLDNIKPSRGENTEALYRNAVEKHVGPQIGGVRLDRLTAVHVQAMLAEWRRSGVGGRTQQVGLATLSQACGVAVGMRLLTGNPCDYVTPPKVERKKIDPFTAEEAAAVLAAAKGDRLEALIVLAFTTGMRPGELFGLPWRCVDFKAGTVRIEQQVTSVRGKATLGPPKTKRSRRTIDLTPNAVAALAEHRKAAVREGKAAAEFVFTAPRGGLLCRGNYRLRTWNPLLKRAGVRGRKPHEVRHTFATLALAAGVPVHVVSGVLGHARASITLDCYSHLLRSHQAEARDAIARLLG